MNPGGSRNASLRFLHGSTSQLYPRSLIRTRSASLTSWWTSYRTVPATSRVTTIANLMSVIRVQSTARRVAALDPNRQGRAVLEIGHPNPIMDHPPRPEGSTLDHLAVQVPVLHCQMPPRVCRPIAEFIPIGGYGFQCRKPIPGPGSPPLVKAMRASRTSHDARNLPTATGAAEHRTPAPNPSARFPGQPGSCRIQAPRASGPRPEPHDRIAAPLPPSP